MKSLPFPVRRRSLTLLLIFAALTVLFACRTLDLAFDVIDPRPIPTEELFVEQIDSTPTRRPVTRRLPAAAPTPAPDTELPQQAVAPTEPAPVEESVPLPTEPPEEPLPEPTSPAAAAAAPSPQDPNATPAPTPCPKQYCVVYHGCQTEGNTIIEGVVYNNGVPENGVAVRVAREPGAYPLVDDFISGNDPINPTQPDPNHPGRYFLQIVAGAPREGNWWVFIVDQPNGTKQISEAQLIHTNDDSTNPANCQHAFVDFVR